MPWLADCGHTMRVWSLEPTSIACEDCTWQAEREAGNNPVTEDELKVLTDMVSDILAYRLDDIPSNASTDDDLNEWFDEWGVKNKEIRTDISMLVAMVDNARQELAGAEFDGRKMIDKYKSSRKAD